jgi:hypothetical protein
MRGVGYFQDFPGFANLESLYAGSDFLLQGAKKHNPVEKQEKRIVDAQEQDHIFQSGQIQGINQDGL